jgi:hypothetical protein
MGGAARRRHAARDSVVMGRPDASSSIPNKDRSYKGASHPSRVASFAAAQGAKVVPEGTSVFPEALKTVRQALKSFRERLERRAADP